MMERKKMRGLLKRDVFGDGRRYSVKVQLFCVLCNVCVVHERYESSLQARVGHFGKQTHLLPNWKFNKKTGWKTLRPTDQKQRQRLTAGKVCYLWKEPVWEFLLIPPQTVIKL